MLQPLNILDHIRGRLPELKKSEAQVADMVLADPHKVLGQSITVLAQAAGVSEATVVRFCRSIGCGGFPDFKLRLAEGQARGTPFVSQDVAPDDDVLMVAQKVFASAAAALNDAAGALDMEAVARAVDLLAGASSILCIGTGASAVVAEDAAHKFLRFGMAAQASADPMMVRMLSVNLGEKGVLLAISNTGRTFVVTELAQTAREQGVPVIAITAPGSPLAAVSTVTIGHTPVEDAEIYTPMASRLVHLAIIDVLSTGVALKIGTGARRHLAKVKAVLADTRAARDGKPTRGRRQ
ncbi:transcriptional regulator HexR [Azospirillum rugosum]|uniref:RpiR family carbohydrate utilization transcriptional regulator n=1 Tax=Azospirillum rugosum TaxID=416170 RepID=A0ABS4SPS7_9PROT|nr:transcriptional regulator HexR [Azospirillum rugosum]MBP2294554.1 RpiR family carbohydrate utilization transcriptional regulator [Azospirillum rugosum]MDQ0524658.1 RpiR family carbohydrate utilization transcriptional regulator [Azospirillum rugosum]